MKIELKNISKSYEEQEVLALDHAVFDQGFVVVLGRNGTGKTTLLRIIAGLETSDSGSILYDGQPFKKDLYKKLTLVEQKPVMLNRSVYDNIVYPLKVRKQAIVKYEKEINHLLEQLELKSHCDKNAIDLSGGECQKVAIARAILCQPEVLLLDEPTANIDETSQLEIEMILKDYVKNGHLVIMVTHDKDQAVRLGQMIINL